MKYSKIFDWNYVPSKLNPADKASRGLTADDLLRDDVWFSGPRFLKNEPSKWSETIPVVSCDDGDIFRPYDLERNVRKCKVANQDTGSEAFIVANVKQTKSAVIDIQPTSKLILHFSSLCKLKLAVSWLCRFMQYFSSSQRKNLSFKARVEADERVIAEMRLFKYVQKVHFYEEMSTLSKNKQVSKNSCLFKLDPFVSGDVLGVGGRLENADLPFNLKHPIILPEHDHLTVLIIQHAHSKSVGLGGVNSTPNFLC